MQEAYPTPAAPVPTSVDMLVPATRPPGGRELELLLALSLPPEDVVPMLAIDGGFAPAPQPAAPSATPAKTARSFILNAASRRRS
jgi:hypothetical protein